MTVPPEPAKPPSIADIVTRTALTASPRFAGSLMTLYEGFRARWVARANEVAEEAAAGIGLERLEARLAESEPLDAAFAAAVEAGTSSAMVAKRRMLGRMIAQAALDDALVDEATLYVGILRQIDTPHVRCMEIVYRAEEEADAAGEVHPRADGSEREINQRIRDAAATQPPPVTTLLVSLGLMEAATTWDGRPLVVGLTTFGRSFLNDLRSCADES